MKIAVSLVSVFLLAVGKVQALANVVPFPVESCEELVPQVPESQRSNLQLVVDKCLELPAVAAANTAYSGPESDRMSEIILTCFAAKSNMFDSSGLKNDDFIESIKLGVKRTRMASSVMAALGVCTPGLLQDNVLVPFMRCIQSKCALE
ncbi:uncharacterized protein LOC108679827 [Hyalella azteca]|uniref:Uncharacterized protein LOC108679827 n=1 Tax=Hyalella azteca TaxID=294128 RepID=A0A8B7PD25_HYAAZ|nr:uncharacterized protein LOC108679827 [Hyalella azteca]